MLRQQATGSKRTEAPCLRITPARPATGAPSRRGEEVNAGAARGFFVNRPTGSRAAVVFKCRVDDVDISRYGRTCEEGKKIGWRDGIRAIP